MTNQYQTNMKKSNVISNEEDDDDVVIIGGGIAGLTAAIFLARAGKSVTIIERSSEVGGRARTSLVSDGFYLNQGPHALYPAGPGVQILKELGINYKGKNVTTDGYYVLKQGQKYPMPITLSQFLTTKLLKGLRSKIEAIRFFASLHKLNPEKIQDMSWQNWIDKKIHNSDVKDLIKMGARITTFANDAEIQSAGSTLSQLQIAYAGGAMYIDGGWQTLVNGLNAAAEEAKVKILTGKTVVSIEHNNDTSSSWILHLSDGSIFLPRVLIIAAGPRDVYEMLKHTDGISTHFLSKIAKESKPVRVATLDIALSTHPNPNVYGAYGLDEPLYLSTHSAFARLSPKGGSLIHVMKYLGSSIQPNPTKDQEELENLMDTLQPGWRKFVVKQRFLPNMIVYNALVTAEQGGIYGRPDVRVPGVENLYIVGDWLGSQGLLVDTSLSTAKRAAEDIILRIKTTTTTKEVHSMVTMKKQ
jgi:phytoene dehydrogenase-like protein